MHVDDQAEERKEHTKGERELPSVLGRPGGLLREAHGPEVDVRVSSEDVGVAVMPDVVRVTPRFFVDRRIPVELLGSKLLRAGQAVVCSVQGRVADLGRLQLLVDPEREDADRERDRLEAEMNEASTEELHDAREAIEPPDVPDVLGADALLHALFDGIELFAESAEALVVDRRGKGQGLGR